VGFINNHMKNLESNTLKIKSIFNEFQDMQNQFSDEEPSKNRDLAYYHLREMNFFEKSDPRLNDEVREILSKCLLIKLQLGRFSNFFLFPY